eukprot:8409858-Ditylum_brightwellii.AAC.1
MKRHGHIIASVRAQHKDISRQEWGVFENLEIMYDNIYQVLEEKGLAVKLDTPVLKNKAGETVTDESKAYGLPVEYELIKPEYFLFADETGCNTNQKKEGRVGGKHYIGPVGAALEIIAAVNDICFTVLPITNALGQP